MIFTLAWRNIWRNKVRSLVIMLSVAIGLFAGVCVLSLYKGMMKSRVRTIIYTELGHLQIHDPQFKQDNLPSFVIPDAAGVLRRVRALPEVRLAAPRSIAQGMVQTPKGNGGVVINGVLPELENQLSQLKNKVIQGEAFRPGRKDEIMIGKKLADKLKLRTGSKLVLTFTDTSENLVSIALRIRGIYQTQNAPLDEVNVFVPLKNLNDNLLTGDGFHEIRVLLHYDEDLERTKESLKNLFPGLQVESWKELSPETDLMVKTVDTYSYIILLIILMALAFGILNTMLMAVLERTREIGMMVALGTSKPRVFMMIFLETIWLTFAGVPFGLVISWLAVDYYQIHGLDLSGMGREMMSSFGFNTVIFPSYPWEKLNGMLIMVAGTAIISCLLPVIKALRFKPVEALRR